MAVPGFYAEWMKYIVCTNSEVRWSEIRYERWDCWSFSGSVTGAKYWPLLANHLQTVLDEFHTPVLTSWKPLITLEHTSPTSNPFWHSCNESLLVEHGFDLLQSTPCCWGVYYFQCWFKVLLVSAPLPWLIHLAEPNLPSFGITHYLALAKWQE